MSKELIERLADIEHQRWADWQKYMHSQCVNHDAEWVRLPRISFDHWERQIATPYADLSEKEKESDRDQVKRYWPLIETLNANCAKAEARIVELMSKELIERLREPVAYGPIGSQAIRDEAADALEDMQEVMEADRLQLI